MFEWDCVTMDEAQQKPSTFSDSMADGIPLPHPQSPNGIPSYSHSLNLYWSEQNDSDSHYNIRHVTHYLIHPFIDKSSFTMYFFLQGEIGTFENPLLTNRPIFSGFKVFQLVDYNKLISHDMLRRISLSSPLVIQRQTTSKL